MILDYHFSEFSPLLLSKSNAEDIVRTMAELGIDSLLLYAKDHWGNCYFATDRFKRHRNVPSDLFGDVLRGLEQRRIGVIAYYSVGWDEHTARTHPDWLLRDAKGQPVHLDYPLPHYARWTFLCTNSPYGDYSLSQLDELTGRYRFGALFLDIFGAFPVCYCRWCRALWREHAGADLPAQFSPAALADYMDFQRDVLFGKYYDRVLAILRKHGRSIPVTHNAGLDYSRDGYVAAEIDPYGADYYRSGLEAKLWRARAAGRETELICHRTNGMFDFTLKPVEALRWEVATAVAHNAAVMFVDQPFADGTIDAAAYRELKKAFQAADDLKPHVTGTTPYAEALILTSERSERLNSAPGGSLFRQAGERADLAGAHKILAELHYPFDLITDDEFARRDLRGVRLLVVPYVRYLAAGVARKIRGFAEDGGTLVFTYRCAEMDEKAAPLDEPCFGVVRPGSDTTNQVSFVKPPAAYNLPGTYLRVTTMLNLEAAPGLSVLATVTDPALRVSDTEWVTHNVIPGEEGGRPAIVSGRFGKGSFLYFAFRFFQEAREQGLGVYRRLLEAALAKVYKPAVRVIAPAMVDAVYCRAPGEIRIVLINGITNRPSGEGNKITIDEAIPVPGILIQSGLALREARDGTGARLSIRSEGSMQRVRAPVLESYGVVRLLLRNDIG